MTQANHDAVIPSSITIDSAVDPVPAVAGSVSTIGAEPPVVPTVSRDCMAAANTYSTPSATGVQRMARVTVTNGRWASRATVLALSKPTNDVMASSRAKPTAECVIRGSGTHRSRQSRECAGEHHGQHRGGGDDRKHLDGQRYSGREPHPADHQHQRRAPTTTASTAMVGLPVRHAEPTQQRGQVACRTQRAGHRGAGVPDQQRPAGDDAGHRAQALDGVAVQPADRDHPGGELADAVPDRRHQQRGHDEHQQGSTGPPQV